MIKTTGRADFRSGSSVGVDSLRFFQSILQRFNRVEGLTLNMAALSSDYWGRDITVTGLLTGHDLLHFLKDTDLGDGIVLPSLMLKQGDVCFLDDLTVDQVSQTLGVPIYVADGVDELVETCCGDRLFSIAGS